ncbi:Uncharacterised protein [Mycobacteroides abscessus subsp. abscessus]|nr:Uncharacterised protein [Mycobacteroides abscessus subsp. abscessus]
MRPLAINRMLPNRDFCASPSTRCLDFALTATSHANTCDSDTTSRPVAMVTARIEVKVPS